MQDFINKNANCSIKTRRNLEKSGCFCYTEKYFCV